MPQTNDNLTKTVLIAPLDWGLGHTTRCIPIIEAFMHKGYTVIVAVNGIRKTIIEEAFPNIQTITIPDYNITYSTSKWKTIIKLFLQSRKIHKAIAREEEWLPQTIKAYNIDIVVADNRYGLHTKAATTIFVTHQLKPKSPLWGFGENILQKKLYRYINQFDYCWVMDNKGSNALAGDLSNPTKLPIIPTTYIGIHTRLQKEVVPIKYTIAIILSGPEPQRTILENKVIAQLKDYTGKVVIIRGVVDTNALPVTNHKVYNLLSIAELNIIINESAFIICRSGYTSVMDLLMLEKKCIFIPTPGQTEQEYLANYLYQKKMAVMALQNNFNIIESIAVANTFQYRPITTMYHNLQEAIDKLLPQ